MKKKCFFSKAFIIYAMALLMGMAVTISCSSDNGDDDCIECGGDPEAALQQILDQLEKNKDLSMFAAAMKDASKDINESELTVIAVKNEAFDDDDEDITSATILRHIVKGTYTLEKLSEVSQLQTIGGTTLEVEYIGAETRADGALLYINDMLVDMSPVKAGGSLIYTTDVFLPASTAMPSPSHDDYLKMLAKKVEGRWEIVQARRYYYYFEDANNYTIIDPSNLSHHGCVETFSWKPISGTYGAHGEYSLSHRCGNTGTEIGSNGVNATRSVEGYWRVVSTTDERAFAELEFCSMLAGSIRRRVSFPLDKSNGIGSHMKYIAEYLGESLDPPYMYPSQRREETFLLRKISNRP